MSPVWFDESMGAMAAAIAQVLGERALKEGVIVRDASGLLSFISSSPTPNDPLLLGVLRSAVNARVGCYAHADDPIVFGDEPGASIVLNDSEQLFSESDGLSFRFIDRRVVGVGWLSAPVTRIASPPRVVFASLKGGVGRSTALVVTAFDFAQQGKKVLAIDLDLEAPGLGELMLEAESRPTLGLVDYLVEEKIRSLDDKELSLFIGASQIAAASGSGIVHVVPAFGSNSLITPEGVLPKLARAMTEGFDTSGATTSIAKQLARFIDHVTSLEQYDVVLIDARAGLGELTAPAVLGLGATVLLFGTAQEQTISGYRAMFAGLKQLARRDLFNGRDADWRLLLKPVLAKASIDEKIVARHADDLYELFLDNVYDEGDSDSLMSISFSPDDVVAPHQPLIIPFDPRFAEFDPTRGVGHWGKPFYEQTFRVFLDNLRDLIERNLSKGGVNDRV